MSFSFGGFNRPAGSATGTTNSPLGTGVSAQSNTQPTSGFSFGNAATTNTTSAAPKPTGLFGNNSGTGMASSSLFGGQTGGSNVQTAAPQQSTTSSFGAAPPANPLQSSLFGNMPGNSNTQPLNGQSQSNNTTLTLLNGTTTDATQIPLHEMFINVANAVDPSHPDYAFSTYFYARDIPEGALASHLTKPENQNAQKWEAAVRQRPDQHNSAPVLAQGFNDVLLKLKVQSGQIDCFRSIMNEAHDKINSLSDKHDLITTVKIDAMKRKLKVLMHRCLVVAIKLEYLKNKGQSLSSFDESLSSTLSEFLKTIDDANGFGKTSEIKAELAHLKETGKNSSGAGTAAGGVTEQDEWNYFTHRKLDEELAQEFSAPVRGSADTSFDKTVQGFNTAIVDGLGSAAQSSSTDEHVNKLVEVLKVQQAGLKYLCSVLSSDELDLYNVLTQRNDDAE